MLPLYREPHFTFRFAEDRIIDRIHLEGIAKGRPVELFRVNPLTGDRLSQLAVAVVGDEGWVNLPAPIIVRTGEAFIAVPAETS